MIDLAILKDKTSVGEFFMAKYSTRERVRRTKLRSTYYKTGGMNRR